MRFGELAGLRWRDVDLEKGSIDVRRQYSHSAWAELKTGNARRTLPLPGAVRDELKARCVALNGNVVRLGPDERTVFTAPEGGPLDYKNFRDRVWAPLLERTAVTGTLHQLRHSYATALIQSGENAKTVQTLMGHHSVAFTMDQYADAWPEALSSAGEKAANLLLPQSGSNSVAGSSGGDEGRAQVAEFTGAPGEIRTPDLLVSSQLSALL